MGLYMNYDTCTQDDSIPPPLTSLGQVPRLSSGGYKQFQKSDFPWSDDMRHFCKATFNHKVSLAFGTTFLNPECHLMLSFRIQYFNIPTLILSIRDTATSKKR